MMGLFDRERDRDLSFVSFFLFIGVLANRDGDGLLLSLGVGVLFFRTGLTDFERDTEGFLSFYLV
jgi:hypothetical protein